MEGVLLNKGYQGQQAIAAHNSAMDMQNKQIRQPGSQAEAAEIIRNCIRHRPEAEPNQSCRSASINCLLDHCFIVRVLPLLCVYSQCLEEEKTGFI